MLHNSLHLTKTRVLLVLCLVLAALIVALIFYGAPRIRQVETKPVYRSGAEISSESSGFLEQWSPATGIPAEVLCRNDGSIETHSMGSLPSSAWRLLAFASRYNTSHNPRYLALMDAEFASISSHADGLEEMSSLWQEYLVYELTGDVRFLSFFIYGAYALPFTLRGGFTDAILTRSEPMTLATLVRTLAMGVRAYSDPEAKAAFDTELAAKALKYGEPPRVMPLHEFEAGQVRLYEEARRLYNVLWAPDYFAESRLQDITLYRQCWRALASYEMSRAFPGDISYLDATKKTLLDLSIDKGSPERFRFITLQQVLPCVEVLISLASSDPTFLPLRNAALEKFIIPAYDGPEAGICGQHGGFVTGRSTEGYFSGITNLKSAADISWLTYIFSKIPAAQLVVGRRPL